jgi:hypothetical protein
MIFPNAGRRRWRADVRRAKAENSQKLLTPTTSLANSQKAMTHRFSFRPFKNAIHKLAIVCRSKVTSIHFMIFPNAGRRRGRADVRRTKAENSYS